MFILPEIINAIIFLQNFLLRQQNINRSSITLVYGLSKIQMSVVDVLKLIYVFET